MNSDDSSSSPTRDHSLAGPESRALPRPGLRISREQRERIEAVLTQADPRSRRSWTSPAPPSGSPPVPEGPDSEIGPYHLLQRLGEGGFGVVYEAEQREPVVPPGGPQGDQARDGLRERDRPLRGGAPGPGHDGSPQHRAGHRRRRHPGGPPVLRDGAGEGRPDSSASATSRSTTPACSASPSFSTSARP